jgi:protease-4
MEQTPFSQDTPPAAPPPLPPAPPIITPPPPGKPRKSRGWMIIAIILGIFLLFSVFGNFAQLASRALGIRSHNFKTVSARQVGPKLDECILEDNDSKYKIAVINVNGIITSHADDQSGNGMVELIKAQLDRASDDDHVKAVILKVDSPGGEVMASDQINKAIHRFENDDESVQPPRHGKPVICSMGSLAASGGYYISAPCRWIVADDLTLTGSIGVIMHGYNYRGLMDKVGISPMTFKSGKFKDMLSPDRSTNEIPPEERAMVQSLIDETFRKFKGVVREGRNAAHEKNKTDGHALKPDWESLADGRVLSGAQAIEAGFVDQLGDFDDAVDKAEGITGIDKANLIEYQERYDISNFLSMFGESSKSHEIKLDFGMEAPRLQPGCLYFLSPSFINY